MTEQTHPDESGETITINGEHTDATIYTTDVDETTIEQVQQITNHEAFQQPIKIMPDAHAGAGAVIGFTMPLGERIVPNCVGVDIGCGMTAFNLGDDVERIETDPRAVDVEIRERVPVGRKTFADVPNEQDYHIVDDFPWGLCAAKARSLTEKLDDIDVDDGYGGEYFKDLCDRVGYSPQRAINSLGTLGGGNHFIEIAQSQQTGNYWVVIHSGSRGIGLSIAKYWQERAHENCDERAETIRHELSMKPEWSYKFDLDEVDDTELLQWVTGGMGKDFKDVATIRERRDGEDIGILIDNLSALARYATNETGGDDLDYLGGSQCETTEIADSQSESDDLDGDLRAGYLKDMIFAQTYALESRTKMGRAVTNVLDGFVVSSINSTHNYIDFEDLTIRKGATRVHEGELAIIPFNMRDGSVIVKGRGNDEWHNSAPHGAGRRGSRRWAHDTFELAEFTEAMEDVFSTSVSEDTLDEAPMAYKDHETVLERMKATAKVVSVLDPVINIKAEE